ncbi:LptF/LptG family permease [bacterium]|nr:LptF/LptG family permease [bacterium]
MNLIDREFISDFFKALATLVFLVAIVVLIDTLLDNYQEILGGTQHGAYWAFMYYVCSLPKKLVESISIATAAAILWVVTTKARHNEILAYLAGGISPQRLAVPLVGGAVLVAVVAIGLNEMVVAPAEREAEVIERVHIKQKDESVITRNKHIYQRGAGSRIYVIDSFDSATDSMVYPIIIDRHKEVNVPERILQADSARLVQEPGKPDHWEFQNATLRTMDTRARITSFQEFGLLSDLDLQAKDGMPKMEPNLQKFLSKLDDPDMMNFWQLWEYTNLLDSQGKQVSKLRTTMHMKLALPLATVVIALLMCAHVMRPSSRGVFVGFGGGMAWVIGYYLTLILFQSLGEQGWGLPPSLAAWLPNIAFSVIGIVSLIRGGR